MKCGDEKIRKKKKKKENGRKKRKWEKSETDSLC